MRIFILSLNCVFCIFADISASDPKFPISGIPEALRQNVNAVMRENKRTFKILARNRATYHVYKAITILNEQGKSFGYEVVGYDKLTKVREFNGSVYDASGKLIKRLKAAEIYDQSAYDGITLFSDNRIKAADLTQGNYPYTVEFEYELELKYLFQIPRFVLLPEEKMSVQQSSFTLQYPPVLKPNYDLLNIDQQPALSRIDETTESLSWVFKNVLPIKEEPHGPIKDNFLPQILAAPSQFEYADYVGSMDTWDQFGQWIATLNEGRDQLPEPTREKIRSLTADLKTTEQKTKALYHYLQNKTRYVGIQLGIGGFQPFEASVVDETGYGDCKALSNYMVAMLKSVGIKSHYALIHAGSDSPELRTTFVSSQFNHAVVAVPNGSDTLWLECTSQTKPFGYAGLATGDRKALLITEHGAKIVNTPKYTAQQNLQTCSADVVVDAAGNAHAKVKTAYRGLQYENSNLHGVLDNQYDEQKKWVLQNTHIPSFDLVSFKISQHKDKVPSAFIHLDLNLNKLANVSGKRLFLTPNLLNRNSYIPEPVEKRKTNVVRKMAYTDYDTIRYRLPDNLYAEFVPQDVQIHSRFGEYEASFKVEEGYLIYIRKLKMNKGIFPPDSYSELIGFFRNINKADNTKMVFASKT
jgi:hypothetical protein